MGLLTGYFDESGIHEGDHTCVVAGFVGNDAQWQGFAAEWIPAIRPRLNLHMTKLRWKQHPGRIAPLLAKLGPIPYRYNLRPVFVRLRWSDYNRIVKGNVSARFTNPYALCAVCCMTEVLSNIAGSDEVYFLFDRQEGLRKKTMQELRDLSFDFWGVDSRVKGIDFIPRQSTVCLDPADYLAFVLREKGIDGNSVKVQMGASIMAGRGGYGGTIAADQLKEMVEAWHRHERGQETMLDILASLAKRPFFRGPR